MDPEAIVAIFAILVIFGLPIGGWIAMRVLRHQERMEMIRRGMVPPPDAGWGFGRQRAWREWQRAQPAPVPAPAAGGDDPQTALFKGIRLAAIGIALVIGLSFIGGTPGSAHFHGGPWLLGGLIPLFVGVAQIAIALLSGAEVPRGRGGYGVPPPPPPAPGPPPPPGPRQQPGRRLEELGKPPGPPDLR